MRAVVTSEARLCRTPDGRVWTRTGPARRFWERYLAVFDEVRVVARVRDVAVPPAGTARVDGDLVRVWPVPHFVGPDQYLRRWAEVRRATRAVIRADDAVILRVPSPIGSVLAAECERRRMPYGLEVVGDPFGVFAPGVVRHPLRPLLRGWSVGRLRWICRRATAVAYVTERALQRRYPAAPTAMTTHYSSVDLPEEAYVPAPRPVRPVPVEPTLACVASLEQLYKGVDDLIDAVARLWSAGVPTRLVVVGEGRHRGELLHRARRAGVADRVRFAGALPAGAPVRAVLDGADLFVLPSRTEGLPRSLIEAMSRALPAVGSTAGGIPELLPAACLVPPDHPAALARAIGRLLAGPALLAEASAVNLRRSRDFAAPVLAARRAAFLGEIRAASLRTAMRGGGRGR